MTTTTTADALASALLRAARADGGVTLSTHGEDVPTDGYLVARPGVGLTLPPDRPDGATLARVRRWVSTYWDTMARAGAYVGAWRDGDGRTYLDIVDRYVDRAEALALALARGELAIWDCARACEIRCNVLASV